VKNNKGFSLLELLIVVAIILIIATIAIPSLIRSRQSANESAAVATLRTLNTAEITYAASGGSGLFATIPTLVAAGLMDASLLSIKSGYSYDVQLVPSGMNYTSYATAASTIGGRYDYYAVPDYIVRFSTTTSRAPAGMAGEPVH
jgi:prepilin-type N-terminal cleavage/methylation domain-containing protein